MKKTTTTFAIAAFAGLSCAHAALINLNIKEGADDTGLEGPTGGAGLLWNQHGSTAATGTLLDSTGAPSSVSMTPTVGSLGSWDAPALTVLQSGYFEFGKGDDFTITLSGLDNGGIYDLWILTRSNGTDSEGNFGTFRTSNSNASGDQVIDSRTVYNGTTWVPGQNYAFFDNIVASSGGVITFTSDGHDAFEIDPLDGNTYRLMVSGLQLNQVPEPSAALLGSLSLLALFRRRR